jgi:hypothetical protein
VVAIDILIHGFEFGGGILKKSETLDGQKPRELVCWLTHSSVSLRPLPVPISEWVEVAVDSSLYVLEFDEGIRKELETLEGKTRELNWFCG